MCALSYGGGSPRASHRRASSARTAAKSPASTSNCSNAHLVSLLPSHPDSASSVHSHPALNRQLPAFCLNSRKWRFESGAGWKDHLRMLACARTDISGRSNASCTAHKSPRRQGHSASWKFSAKSKQAGSITRACSHAQRPASQAATRQLHSSQSPTLAGAQRWLACR